ncbi:hypothetical protein [Bacillus sp. SG-1]|uniref:hypothetical protein n=1 Tax=Bacillus sp. SG-1 TaxID=161544 RepID=UPI0001544BED|nr:hypothetical protein [Bacillus sp. SG-1]EDL64098.1 hypothetical protein BSG1_13041 [Bacillus sp. SG-1]
MNRKALVVTGLNENLYEMFPLITGKHPEEILIMSSFGAEISQPYGCSMRSLILAVTKEEIEEVYVVGEECSVEYEINQEELLMKLRNAGVRERTIQTINYIDAVRDDLLKWLTGHSSAKGAVLNSVKMIKRHPLIPLSLPVYGYTADIATGEFYPVIEKEQSIAGRVLKAN